MRLRLALIALLAPWLVQAAPYRVDYVLEPEPARETVRVQIRLSGESLPTRLNLRIDPARHSDISVDGGELDVEGRRAIWRPARRGGTLSLRSKVSHRRKDGRYDALMTRDWAIFRGDDVIPAAQVRARKGAKSRARLRFELPPGWTNVDTGWPRDRNGEFVVDNPERRFDRPIGWMVAGKVGTRRDRIGLSEVAVGAPRGNALHRMDVLAFLNMAWPEAEHAFGRMPKKLLVVGAGDPMWRGGLSAPNSLFLHADRPLVSENGTSSLLHELAHVATRIRGERGDDWIAEGLAEFYAIELLHRAGGLSDSRRDALRRKLEGWGREVETLRGRRSTGPVTARAVVWFMDLDAEIRRRTGGKRDLDDLTRVLMKLRKVSTAKMRGAAEQLVGGKIALFDDELLKPRR